MERWSLLLRRVSDLREQSDVSAFAGSETGSRFTLAMWDAARACSSRSCDFNDVLASGVKTLEKVLRSVCFPPRYSSTATDRDLDSGSLDARGRGCAHTKA